MVLNTLIENLQLDHQQWTRHHITLRIIIIIINIGVNHTSIFNLSAVENRYTLQMSSEIYHAHFVLTQMVLKF